jgi:serine/threonine protein kinase
MASTGDKVKHYEILDQIGKGGMGEVYSAQDTSLDRKVAIKFLPEEMQKDAKARVRLVREAKAAASLDHPFICKIFETGEFEGKAYIVMEYIEGIDLREKLDEGTLSMRDALQMALEIAEALEEAHEKGIIHRDLKPANIMITPRGHVKVMDFGLAKHFLTEGEGDISQTMTQESLTEHGAIVGTLAYMSPEQARGESVDVRSDIFSLGIILYEMTTGRHPFSKSNPLETLTSYQNIKELIDAIHKFQKDFLGGGRLHLRWWQIAAGAALIIAMIITGALWLTRRPDVQPLALSPIKLSILISDFENKTGDPVFDGALEQAFGLGLDAPLISIYDRPTARNLMKQLSPGADDRLDVEQAKLICAREGINVILAASIEPKGDGYVIKVWAIDSVTSKKIVERTETIKTKADVLQAVPVLAAELRSELSGIPLDSAQTFEEETSTTTSLEALNAYNHAQELIAEGKQDEAIDEYLRAIKEDPEYGRAYSGLGVIYLARGEREKGKEYLRQALNNIGSMTERERYRTRCIWYGLTRDYQKIIEESVALLEKYPADSAGHGNLSYAYFMVRNLPKAAEHGEIMAELYPKNVGARFNLSWYALGAGDFKLAKQEANKTSELIPEYEGAYITLALSELGLEQSAQAEKAYEQLKTLSSSGSSLGTMGLADIALYEGRLDRAREILEEGIGADLENKTI